MAIHELLPQLDSLSFINRRENNMHVHHTADNNEYKLINNSCLLTLLAFPAGTVRSEHRHEETRVTTVRSGKCRIRYGHKVAELEKGDTLVLGPGIAHSLEVIGNNPLTILEMVVEK
jgi:quercetin dioxygenase-like cupin family protein